MSDKLYLSVYDCMTEAQHKAVFDLYMNGVNHDGHTWVTFKDVEHCIALIIKDNLINKEAEQ